MRCRFIYSPHYYCDIGAHVFPTAKFRLLRDRLSKDRDIPPKAFLAPEPCAAEDAGLVHTPAYLEDLLALRFTPRTAASELPISQEIVNAYFLAAGGTILACEKALEGGLAMNLTGGFHHAFPDHAEGFCYLNDVAIAIRKMQQSGRVTRAAVIDCDLHQGNGTAFIFQESPSVFTFSIHQENLYPIKQQSDLDIALEDGVGDDEYLDRLREHVPRILEEHRPELALYLAGADPYEDDQLGDLKLTIEGLRRRDELVVETCAERSIPLAAVLAGGYALDTEDTLRIHHGTCRVMWEQAQGDSRDKSCST